MDDRDYREVLRGFPFELRGKLSTTPEQAKSMFGFKMKRGAIGIIFERRNSRELGDGLLII
ncbi:hypothetical protein KAW65_09240 [candidate division WOR-3 bacterium]|nr:hypothetical protein [candidate division WOR-3 bacterium]